MHFRVENINFAHKLFMCVAGCLKLSQDTASQPEVNLHSNVSAVARRTNESVVLHIVVLTIVSALLES